jgi:NitT/TauT family transport system substrate-binding protein
MNKLAPRKQLPVRPFRHRLAVVVILLALLAGCAPVASTANNPEPAPSGPPRSVPANTPGAAAALAEPAVAQPLSPPLKLRLSMIGLSGEAGLYLAQERGYFQDEGLDVEFVPFRSAAEALPALATGELQIGSGAPDPSVFNAARRDMGVKLISSLSVVTPPDTGSGVVVRQDHFDSGRYHELSDLRGMNVALHILGTTPQLYLERVLAKGGLRVDDVQLTVVQIPDQLGALANKAVDAAWAIDPFGTVMEGQGLGKRVIAVGDVFPGAISMILLLSPVFERQQPEAVRRFAVAYLRGARDYYQVLKNHEGRDEIIAVLTQYTNVKDPALYARIAMPYIDPNGALDRQVLDTMQDYFLQAGTQQEKQDVNRVVDSTYMDYAVERLGRITP